MKAAIRFVIALSVCGLVLYSSADAIAQLGVEWVRTADGPASDHDGVTALAVGANGDVYVSGYQVFDSTVWGCDDCWCLPPTILHMAITTIRYSPTGDIIWQAEAEACSSDYVDDCGPVSLAVAADQHVYLAGASNEGVWSGGDVDPYDFKTIKYSPQGNPVWERRYDGPQSASDRPFALALDASDNVLITGPEDYKHGCFGWSANSIATLKYSSDGDTIWVRQLGDSSSQFDVVAAQFVGASGNVHVTGTSVSQENYVTATYSAAGDTLWVRHYDGTAGSSDFARGVGIDSSGNVYVTGTSDGVGTFSDFATIKYSPNGNVLWVRRYDGPSHNSDKASALAVDATGNVYVTGSSLSNSGLEDYATIKYSPTGDTLWVRRYDGPANSNDMPTALTIDVSGNVYVTGTSYGSGTSADLATLKYSPNGDTLWIRRYNGSGSGDDKATTLALDVFGNIIVAGYSTGVASRTDYITIKYSNPVGDVYCDGIIDLVDVVLLGNYIDGLIDLTSTCGGGQADVDQDGDVDEDDYNMLFDALDGDDDGFANGIDNCPAVYNPAQATTVSLPGDANQDDIITSADIIHDVNYVFKSGPTPMPCAASGDVTCDGVVNSSDLISLVNHVFKSGSAPCEVCDAYGLGWTCP